MQNTDGKIIEELKMGMQRSKLWIEKLTNRKVLNRVNKKKPRQILNQMSNNALEM